MTPADGSKHATSMSGGVDQAQNVRKHLWVSGEVQGVWFRQATKDAAADIGGLQGWVRNLVDGRVEVVVQGAPQPVERLVAFCREGPPAADVEDVEVKDEEPVESEREFHVTR